MAPKPGRTDLASVPLVESGHPFQTCAPISSFSPQKSSNIHAIYQWMQVRGRTGVPETMPSVRGETRFIS
jgi:hypothetical protein